MAIPQHEERTGASAKTVIVVLGVVVVITIVFVWWPATTLRDELLNRLLVDVSEPVPGFSGRAAIAVLAFDNLSDDPTQDYFADGLTDGIITGLQRQGWFPVIARNSTFTYKGSNVDAREVARDLGAGYVLEGSVQRRADSLRVSAQLIDAEGLHLWAEKYDGPLTDVFDIQNDIIANIVETVVPELQNREMARVELVHPDDLQAWDYLLKAEARNPVDSLEETRQVEDMVWKALDLDPRFGVAYISLARIYSARASRFGAPFDETTAQAIDYARRAKQIDPFDVSICSCLGTYLTVAGRIEEALLEHEIALDLNPSSAQAHGGYAWTLIAAGRPEKALKHARVAMRLSPRDPDLPDMKAIEGIGLMMLDDLDGAIRSFRHATGLGAPSEVHVYLIAAEHVSGNADAAGKSVERMTREYPGAPLTQLLPRLRYERSLTTLLRDHLRNDFPGDIDSANELEVFGYLLRQAGWDGALEAGPSGG